MKVIDKAAVRVNSNGSGVSPKVAGEIDLYDELAAFIELSPVEKQRYLDRSETRSPKDSTKYAVPESVGTVVSEQIDVEAFEPSSESDFIGEDPKRDQATEQPSAQVADELGAGAAFAEMNPQYVFTNNLSGQACRTCGAQSEADDLFCMTCGAFLNGVGAPPFDPSCADCSRDIQAGEIFCPWCGSTLPAG